MEQYCTFRLHDCLFGIPVDRVQEVFHEVEMTRVPLARAEVTGLINLRGQIVTALDLRRRLGLADADEERSRTNVVVRTAAGPVSLLVDRIGEVMRPDDDTTEEPPHTVDPSLRRYVHRVCKLDDELLLLLDVEEILALGPATHRGD